jgi:hypothetical protein
MEPERESTHTTATAGEEEGLGEHSGATEATTAVETLSGRFADLDDVDGG